MGSIRWLSTSNLTLQIGTAYTKNLNYENDAGTFVSCKIIKRQRTKTVAELEQNRVCKNLCDDLMIINN